MKYIYIMQNNAITGNNQGFSPGPINNYGSPGPNNQQQPGQNGPTNNYLNWMPQHPNGSQQVQK